MINKTDKKNSLLDLIKFISTILIIVAHSLIEFNKKIQYHSDLLFKLVFPFLCAFVFCFIRVFAII